MSRNSNGSGEWVLGYLHGESGVDPDSFGGQRAEKVPLDAVIQKCEERNKDGGKGVSCSSVELDR